MNYIPVLNFIWFIYSIYILVDTPARFVGKSRLGSGYGLAGANSWPHMDML